MTAEPPRYEFGPLERRGVIAGLTGAQLALLTNGLAAAVVTVRIDGSAVGFAVALLILGASVATAFWPLAGRPAYEWLPVMTRWAATRLTRRNRYRSAVPLLGMVAGQPVPQPPPALAGVRILAHPVAGAAHPLGVVHDPRAGTYTAILAVRGRSFELAGVEEKVRRLQAWGGLLAGLARASSPVHRLQWVERTVADDGDELGRYLGSAAQVPADHPSLVSYVELVDAAGPASQPHELFLVVSVSAVKSRRAIRTAGGGDAGACQILARELGHLQRDLGTAEIIVDAALTPRLVARCVRTAFDPSARGGLARRAAGSPGDAGTSAANAWPLATSTTLSCYATESAWHVTYWVAQWPRSPVGPDFLAHLLLGTTATRTVSVTMEPVSPHRAHREVENALVQGLADDELRARAGFLGTARRRRERESVARREEELAAGHADYRLSAYVTVTAGDREMLEVACGEVEQAAERSRLELRRLHGEQDTAFTYTLPLARGLR